VCLVLLSSSATCSHNQLISDKPSLPASPHLLFLSSSYPPSHCPHCLFFLFLFFLLFYTSFSPTFLDTYSHHLLSWIYEIIILLLLLIFLMFLWLSVFNFIFLVGLYFSYFMTFQGLMTIIIKIAVFWNIALLYLNSKLPNLLPPFSKQKQQVPLRTLVSICYPTQH